MNEKTTPIIVFKGFDRDFKCRDTQYAENQIFEHEGELRPCRSGIHACKDPLDVLRFYSDPSGKFAECEASGSIVEDTHKIVTNKLRIKAEFGFCGLMKAGFELIRQVCEKSTDANTAGDEAHANTAGDEAHANTAGDEAHANTAGDEAHANTAGFKAHANTAGFKAHANTAGSYAHANTAGFKAHANTAGSYAHANTAGDEAHANTAGDEAHANTAGDEAHANTAGSYAHANTAGDECIASSVGIGGNASGALGNWLVLAEWHYVDNEGWKIKSVQTAIVDDKAVKANTLYILKDGQFVEAEKKREG